MIIDLGDDPIEHEEISSRADCLSQTDPARYLDVTGSDDSLRVEENATSGRLSLALSAVSSFVRV